MTKQQKKDVRRALRRYGREAEDAGWADREAWGRVIGQVMDYYAGADPVCARLLQLRYLEGVSEWETVGALYIGRTTYYRKELEALSNVAVYAAKAGLI